MGITIFPVTEEFVAEIGDIDLSQPLSDAEFRIIEAAFERYAVLVFPDQTISHDQQIAFARRFGPMERSIAADLDKTKPRRVPPELVDVSNLDTQGQIVPPDDRMLLINLGNQLWHTDSSFKPVPAKASLLYMRAIPQTGGQTEFADLRAAWDALPETLRRKAKGRVAEHAIAYSRVRAQTGLTMSKREQQALPAVRQALVRNHRASGRKSLYLGSHAGRIVGMTEQEGAALLDALTAFATQHQFVYTHRWRANDLVMWDDRCTLHRGRPFDDRRWKRAGQRATVSDVANTLEQEGIRVSAEG
jgi:alpha-ketoglutarate-dependent 2,4-dichlorophenoxyacetate dioxygenase